MLRRTSGSLPLLSNLVTRRCVLGTALAAAGGLTALALAGCVDGGDPAAVTATPPDAALPTAGSTTRVPPGAGSFDSGGVPIHYEVFGAGRPIILLHGFTASLLLNWVATGWVEELTAIRQVVGLDARGHGQSGKPHDPAAYAGDAMPDDVIGLMDHLGIERADLMGYSMGAAISLHLLAHHQERFTSVVLAGVGEFARDASISDGSLRADAMLTDDPDSIADPTAKGFRVLAEALGNDLEALAAYSLSSRDAVSDEALAAVEVPVLIVNGADDDLVGSPDALAAAIPTAELVKIPGTDHLTTVADPRYKQAVVDFLTNLPPA